MSEIVRDIIREVLAPGVFDNIRDVANRNAARDIRRLALAAGAGAVVIHVGEAVGGLVLHVGKEAAEAVAAHGTGEFGEFCNKTAETLVEHGLDAGEEVAEEAHAERKAAARAGDIVVTGPGTRAADVVFDLSDHAMAAIADEIQDVDRHHIGEDTVHGVAAMAKTGAFAMAASGLVGVAFSAPVSLSVGGAVLLGALAKGFLKQRAERLEAKATGRSHVSEASFAVANQLGIQKTGVLASLTRFVRSVVDLKVQPAVSSTGIIHPTNGQEPGASHVGYAYVAGDNDISFVRIRLPMSEELCRNRLPHYVVGDAMDAKGNRVFTLSDGRSGGIRVVSDKNGDVARLDFPAADPQTAFLGGRLGGAFRPYDLVAAAAKTGVNAPEYGPAAVVQTRTLNTEALVSQVQLLRRAAVLNKADMAALRELHVNRHDSRDWDPTDLRRPLTSATILNAERYMAEFGRLEKTLAHIQRCSEYLALSGIPNVTLPCPPDASQMSADSLRQTAECMTQIAREAQSRNRASPAELSLIGVYMDKGVPMVLMEHGGEGRRIAIKFDKFVDNAARYQEFGALLSDAKAIKASVFPDGAISIIGVPTEEEAAALRAQAASVNPRQTPIQRKHG